MRDSTEMAGEASSESKALAEARTNTRPEKAAVVQSSLEPRSKTTAGSGRVTFPTDEIPEFIKEIEDGFKALKEDFESVKPSYENSLPQLYKRVGDMEENLSEESHDLFLTDPEEFKKYEDWQEMSLSLLKAVKDNIDKALEVQRKEAEKSETISSFGTYFKKQEPPQFKGDCIDNFEFKRRWNNSVHSFQLPPEHEIDLLKTRIPDEGKKKLYGVESLSSAWLLLDKLFGDKQLICQKLKSRLKNIEPKATEPHEVVIEMNTEIEYLNKRLQELGAGEHLKLDIEFILYCFRHLPPEYQNDWVRFEKREFDNRWEAFLAFMDKKSDCAFRKRALTESLKEMYGEVQEEKPNEAEAMGTLNANDATAEDIQNDPISHRRLEKIEEKKHCVGSKLRRLKENIYSKFRQGVNVDGSIDNYRHEVKRFLNVFSPSLSRKKKWIWRKRIQTVERDVVSKIAENIAANSVQRKPLDEEEAKAKAFKEVEECKRELEKDILSRELKDICPDIERKSGQISLSSQREPWPVDRQVFLKGFACNFCDKKYKCEDTLQVHVRFSHEKDNLQEVQSFKTETKKDLTKPKSDSVEIEASKVAKKTRLNEIIDKELDEVLVEKMSDVPKVSVANEAVTVQEKMLENLPEVPNKVDDAVIDESNALDVEIKCRLMKIKAFNQSLSTKKFGIDSVDTENTEALLIQTSNETKVVKTNIDVQPETELCIQSS